MNSPFAPILTPLCWLAGPALAAWALTLWFLSSNPQPGPEMPEIPHLDKAAHFSYFFIGGALIQAFRSRRGFSTGIVPGVIVLAIIGAADEFRQSFIEGRSGNDPWDWTADVVGAIAGALALRAFLIKVARRSELTSEQATGVG